MMSNKLLVEGLDALAHLEIDAILAAERMLVATHEPLAKAQVEAFKQQRERHLEALRHLLFNHGGKDAPLVADWRGVLLEGVAATLGHAGPRATLLAMFATASVLASGYKAQPLAPFPADARRVIGPARDEVVAQVEFLKAALRHGLPRAGAERHGEAPAL